MPIRNGPHGDRNSARGPTSLRRVLKAAIYITEDPSLFPPGALLTRANHLQKIYRVQASLSQDGDKSGSRVPIAN